MKKNITINLSGRLYQIDEDAYEMLRKYVESLRASFGRQAGGDEIVGDIEARIAELFDELKQQGVEAITIEHVKSIITRIGEPEQIASEDEGEQERKTESVGEKINKTIRSTVDETMAGLRGRTAGKKLYRNPKDKVLAGVMSGLAAYTGTDAVVWRLALLLFSFFYGIGIVFYIIMAIIVPEARTPQELLMMEGKDVTPQSLADVVVEKESGMPQSQGAFRTLLSALVKIVMFCVVALMIVIFGSICLGIIGALVSSVSILSLPLTITTDAGGEMPEAFLSEMQAFYSGHPALMGVFVVSLIVLLVIPLYAIVHAALSTAGKTKPTGVTQRIVLVALWIAALCCIVPTGASIAHKLGDSLDKFGDRSMSIYEDVWMNSEDRNFLKREGWKLIKHENCKHYTKEGWYYNGRRERYLDGWNRNGREVYQAEKKEAIEPGVYRLDCVAKAEGPGAFVYAIGDEKKLKEIPAYGDKGGEIAERIRQEIEEGGDVKRIKIDMMGMSIEVNDVNGKHGRVVKGAGWSVVSIEGIEVSGDSIAYGISNDAEFTGAESMSRGLSAGSFKLTRTGDLPKGKK